MIQMDSSFHYYVDLEESVALVEEFERHEKNQASWVEVSLVVVE